MYLSFAESLKIVLAREGVTVEELAKMLGCSKQNLYQQIKRDNFKEKDMLKICDLIGYDLKIDLSKN